MEKVEVLKPYGLATPGEVLTVNKPIASLLVQRGVARYVKKESLQKPKKLAKKKER